MRRTISALFMAAAVSGCMSANHNPQVSNPATVRASGQMMPMQVPGVTGPWGEPIPMQAPYTAAPPMGAWQARQMMSQSVPLDMVQMGPGGVPVGMPGGPQMPGMPMPPNGMPMMAPGGMLTPSGVPFGPQMMPPTNMSMPAGAMAPGSMPLAPANYGPGAVAAIGAMPGPGYLPGGPNCAIGRTQVRFTGPNGMRIAWLVQGADGKAGYSPPMVETPGRYNFTQASIYRLKLSKINSGPPGLEVYPTLEVVPANRKTEAFLAHSAVPLEFTAEDFKEVAEGKYLVKVIYLPDPQFQELAATGTDQIISTRLEPGADPILEAQRRGSILLVIRMGNVDQEAPNTPPLDAVSPPQGAMGMMPPPGFMPPGVAGSAVPPYLRGGPGAPATPPTTGPTTPFPALPGMPMPPSPPGPHTTGGQLPAAPALQPTSTLGTLPDVAPRPDLSTVLPQMPPTPAALATQGAKQ